MRDTCPVYDIPAYLGVRCCLHRSRGAAYHEVLGTWLPQEMKMEKYQKLTKAAFTLMCLPICFFRELQGLRHTSLLSVVSVAVLAAVIGIRSIQDGIGFADPSKIMIWPKSFGDVFYALPLFLISYLCHFNVLPMSSELRIPTRPSQDCRSLFHRHSCSSIHSRRNARLFVRSRWDVRVYLGESAQRRLACPRG